MRVAVAQAPLTFDVDSNIRSAVELIGSAATGGARLLVLSELFLQGYRADAEYVRQTALTTDDARLEPIRRACAEFGVSAVVGASTKSPDADTARYPSGHGNSLLWFGADASVSCIYSKTHLWEGEKAAFSPGAGGIIVPFEGLLIGLGICYDAAFPEFVRSYAQLGAELLVFSSAFARGAERSRYLVYHPARALESGAYLAVSNTLGTDGEIQYFGESGVYDPHGQVVSGGGAASGITIADIDPGHVVQARAALPYLSDLQHDYTPLLTRQEMP
ncbi:carbon-nitrogen hydrolase family protein [Arthrobacter sp. MW3 TE3886]|uniref:carbon-nitrogen hydrolase family protein n=1 Tax=Arthrobacter sp. MW3 TE3886 TaxID=3156254 RepID=UPI00351173A5